MGESNILDQERGNKIEENGFFFLNNEPASRNLHSRKPKSQGMKSDEEEHRRARK